MDYYTILNIVNHRLKIWESSEDELEKISAILETGETQYIRQALSTSLQEDPESL
jgi:hypothetical protein